jgi:hypothetical protein
VEARYSVRLYQKKGDLDCANCGPYMMDQRELRGPNRFWRETGRAIRRSLLRDLRYMYNKFLRLFFID